jgi:hypothetical protein
MVNKYIIKHIAKNPSERDIVNNQIIPAIIPKIIKPISNNKIDDVSLRLNK